MQKAFYQRRYLVSMDQTWLRLDSIPIQMLYTNKIFVQSVQEDGPQEDLVRLDEADCEVS